MPDAGNLYPIAANIQSPSDAELLDILQRALRGDPYPVSGHTPAPPKEPPLATPPLASLIREILKDEPAENAQRLDDPAPAVAAPSLQPLPMPVDEDAPACSSSAIPAMMTAAERPARRWGFGLPSIAFVAAVSIAGVCLPALLALPPRYLAEARLQSQGEAIAQPGFLDATAKRIVSPHLLSQAVAKLKLDRDPEFTGGKLSSLGVALDLFSGSGGASDTLSRAQAALRSAVVVSGDARTGALRLSVTTGNAAKSVQIANLLADAAVYDAVVTRGTALQGRSKAAIDARRKAYDQATADLAAFKAQNGDEKIAAAADLLRQRQDLDLQIKAAEQTVMTARTRLAAARTARLADVLDGSLSPDMASSAGLEDLRNRYAAARTVLTQLSAQLGPRHPRLLAQQSTVDGLRADIQTELQRLTASCETDLKAALDDQKALAGRAAAQESKTDDIDMARFTRLQDDVEQARSRYQQALQGTGTPSASASPVPLTVALPAVTPIAPVDDNLAGDQTTGFLMGLGIALCLVFLRAWIMDAVMGEEEKIEVPLGPTPPGRSKPTMSGMRPPMEPPPQKFDADIPVANDRPPVAEPVFPAGPEAGDELEALRRRMASLRAKVETYALQRQGGQR